MGSLDRALNDSGLLEILDVQNFPVTFNSDSKAHIIIQ